MTVHGRRLAVVAVSVGIAVATGHGVAWAEPDHGETSGSSTTSSTDAGTGGGKPTDADSGSQQANPDTAAAPKKPVKHPNSSTTHQDSTKPDGGSTAADTTATQSPTSDGGNVPPPSTDPSPTPEQASTAPSGQSSRPAKPTAKRQADANPPADESPTQARTTARSTTSPKTPAAEPATTEPAATTSTPTATIKAAAVVASAPTITTTPAPVAPLSPIAELVALPGRIVDTLLQALDLTVAAGGPKSPFDFTPIDEMLFAAFRRVEGALGLAKTPSAQPVATETYTGPTTAVTPTVTQFLNGSAAEYVLGGTPGGLQPLTVDGLPVTSTNVLTGEAAQAWVTPQKQIIIAYQGTTGGTNLLFNPLIAISQILTDAQVILTNTTPLAFTDALAFEQRVQSAAVAQGYAPSDIFLTGHSLGGWEAEYVAQQTGLGGIGFESPGINTVVPGNGAGSGFVNVETYGDTAAYSATDLPGLQPFLPAYVPGGGIKPHYGSIVMIGDPDAVNPLINASALLNTSLIGDVIFAVDVLGNFFEHHLPGMQAYNLGISPDPGVVPWLGSTMGPVLDWGDLTISQLQQAASLAGTLITP
jgi:hypothetical protein